MKIYRPNYNWKQYAHGSISLCMIMRNEERRLSRCLESVRGLCDEIIIVDTGSTDKSIEIAKSYQAKVLVDPWQDDFARPRNLGIAHATKQWVLILDPDEVIDRQDIQKLKTLTLNPKYVAYRMPTKNYSPARVELGSIPVKPSDTFGKGFAGYTISVKTRFFKNGLGIKFTGCYHELLDYHIVKNNLPFSQTTIPVHHWVHEIAQGSQQEKMAFYLRLAQKKIEEEPNNLHAWWEAGVTFAIAGYRHKAIKAMRKSMESGTTDQNRLFLLARLLNLTGKQKESRLSFEKGICRLFPNLTHFDPRKKPLNIL